MAIWNGGSQTNGEPASKAAKSGGERGLVSALRALLVAAVVLPLAIFAAASWREYERSLHEAELRAGTTADVLHENAVQVIDTNAVVLDEVTRHIAGMSWPAIAGSREVHDYLVGFTERLPQIQSVFLVAPDGHIASSSRAFPMRPYDVRKREYFLAHAEKGQRSLFLSAPFRGMMEGTYAFTLSQPRLGLDGSFDGVVAITVEPDYFEDFYHAVLTNPGATAALVRVDGAVLARYPDPSSGPSRLEPGSRLLRAAAAAPSGLLDGPSPIDGKVRLVAFRRLETEPKLVVFFALDKSTILAEWRVEIVIFALLALATSAGLSVTTLMALRRVHLAQAAYEHLAAESRSRERAEQALQHARRSEALGRLTGGVAHDFNNLLMVLSGNIELLASAPDLGGRGRKALAAMERTVTRAAALTRGLLTFARRQPLNPARIDVAHWFEGVGEMLARSLRGDIIVKADFPSDLWPIEVDQAQLEFAVLNLAVNARDAMPRGGTLTIGARNRPQGAAMPDGRTPGDFVELTVVDTGIGMSREVLAKALDPFFTTKDAAKGSGLGLSQAYGFAHQSGGILELESSPGLGTTVHLWFPRAKRRADAAVEPAPPSSVPMSLPPERKRRGNILLVEDDPAVAETTAGLLAEAGYRVTSVSNPAAAFMEIDARGHFDVVLSDILMPGGMNGLDLAHEMRRRSPSLPVVLVTGYSEVTPEAAALGLTILRKPFTGRLLREAIEAARGAKSESGAKEPLP